MIRNQYLIFYIENAEKEQVRICKWIDPLPEEGEVFEPMEDFSVQINKIKLLKEDALGYTYRIDCELV